MKKSEVRLTQLASAAGCGAKIGPKVLAQVVGKLPKFTDPMLLVGPETSDDAAVYKINDELAMIHTVDFFPPVVDDPYEIKSGSCSDIQWKKTGLLKIPKDAVG